MKRWYSEEIRGRKTLSYRFRNSGQGCDVIECIWDSHPCPIGTVWYRHVGKDAIEVLGSYVIDHYRRLGVRTYLHEALIKSYPKTKTIFTGEGTKDGKPWLKATGFRPDPVFGWIKKL